MIGRHYFFELFFYFELGRRRGHTQDQTCFSSGHCWLKPSFVIFTIRQRLKDQVVTSNKDEFFVISQIHHFILESLIYEITLASEKYTFFFNVRPKDIFSFWENV